MIVSAAAYGHNRMQVTVTTAEGEPAFLSLPLPVREPPKDRMINISGLQVRIVDERYEERNAEGKLVSPQDYLRKVRSELQTVCASLFELRARWSDPARRRELLAELERRRAVQLVPGLLRDVQCPGTRGAAPPGRTVHPGRRG